MLCATGAAALVHAGVAGSLPPLNPQQQLKLKQLSVVSRALKVKVRAHVGLAADHTRVFPRSSAMCCMQFCSYDG